MKNNFIQINRYLQMLFRICLFISSISLLAMTGCANDVTDVISETGTITGRISSFEGTDLSGVKVSASGKSAYTDDTGRYTVNDLPESERTVVHVKKDGYVPSIKIIKIKIFTITSLDINLISQNRAYQLDSTVENTITDNQGEITIPADALTYYDDTAGTPFAGTYECSITLIDPSDEHGKDIFPGEFTGMDPDSGEQLPLISFGYFNLTLEDKENDRQLQLLSGESAQITIPIPAELQGTAPPTMGFWSFNEDNGIWYQEGTLTRNSMHTAYEGDIGHFSFFGAAQIYTPSYVSGSILDCDLNPLEGAEVIISGTDPLNTWKSISYSTAPYGDYRIPVYPDTNAVIAVLQNGQQTNIGQDPIVTPPAESEIELDDIATCTTYKKVEITLEWDHHPRDLDALLSIPQSGDPILLNYKMANSGTAELIEDNSQGNGTEIIRIYDLLPGVYRYSVHHYAGSGTMSTTAVQATIVIEDYRGEKRTIIRTPSSGGQGVNDIWVVWEFTVSDRSVADIKDINTISTDKLSIHP